MPRLFFIILAALATAQLGAATASDWTKIKTGMAGDEALKHLGEPLFSTTGRGFEVWIYDGRGEAVFAGGPLKSWTVATPTPESLARPVEHDVLIKPSRPTRTRLAPVQALPPRTYSDESPTRFRYTP